MMDWLQCIKTFQTAVEEGSFAKAARRLYATPSAVSKRISWLEDELKVELFQRTTRQITLTQPGRILYKRSKLLIVGWEEVKQEVKSFQEEPQGPLCICSHSSAGKRLITPALPSFIEQYPKVRLNIIYEGCIVDLGTLGVDIFIGARFQVVNPDALHSELLGSGPRKLFASPNYIEKYGTPTTLEDLHQHKCLVDTLFGPPGVWEFKQGEISVGAALFSNNINSLVDLSLAGLGIILISADLGKIYESKGELVSVLPDYHTREYSLYAFMPKTRFLPLATQVFVKHIKDFVAQYKTYLSKLK